VSRIHSTAVVHPEAKLHDTVEVGAFAVIGPKVRVGAGSKIGPHAVVEGDTVIGERNRIWQFASVGAEPQDLKYAGEDTKLVVGDDNMIREFTTLHKGTTGGGGVTRIGNKNLFMAYSHVAHDCLVGNGCVFANSATLAGHVEIGDFVTVGGLSAVHQFTRIGKYAFIAGGSMVVMDVPPYCTAQGDRAELVGLNTVGLTRRGFTDEQMRRVKEAYRLMFRSKLGFNEGLAQVRAELGEHPELEEFITFLTTSKRGITR
jgi:UDP-N-acetylglucosamine acyltransferase